MKLAIPSDGKLLSSPVSRSFGRTSYFIVADTEATDFTVIDNAAAAAQGGAGIKAAQSIADSGAEIVVTFHCGQNAADVLKDAGIKILKATAGTAADQIEAFKKGSLQELTEIHAGYHGGHK
ncbi:MAG: NifB/NifX family molybdenum-iron cluster-binding protein [Oscillospiraceae bacterium]|jgi:predicted Fe-Mo cluster-binding NifX family protein|nr:NifB/NifX family molybdenum-iron cluster-binding protein [Oscillospiraceae bacterium]